MEIQGFERKEESNPFHYTEDQLVERKLAIKSMIDLWPGVCQLHAEWVYDLCKNGTPDELQTIMNKVDTVPPAQTAQKKNIDTI